MTWRRAASMVAVLVLTVAAVGGWRWWRQHPPYGPEALHLRSSLEFVGYDGAQAALGRAYQAPVAYDGDQRVHPIATAPVSLPDLLLALVYMGPDGQVYWARRLQG
ncbi:hypothetical protein [Micromonospora sp. NPDC048887]|uniref:hypothetical protein n=1 Tax=unclassified Micromonospora TaxID=2617518 RepID=UPI0033E881F1